MIDEEAAQVVKQIFALCMEGKGPSQIAALLEKEKVAEVLDKVARYYDVSIQYDKDAASRRLSGKLNLCDSIESVLDIIKVSASLQMEKTGDNKYRFY